MRSGTATASALDTSKVFSLDVDDDVNTEVKAGGSNGGIHNLTSLQFSEAVFGTFEMAPRFFNFKNNAMNRMGAPVLLGLVVGQLHSFEDKNFSLEALFNPETLQRTTSNALAGVSQQFIQHYLVLPDDRSTLTWGTLEHNELRLHTRPAALWATVGVFSVLAAAILNVIWYTRLGVAPPLPAVLMTSASALFRSPDVAALLCSAGAIRLSQLRERLDNYEFAAIYDTDGTPRIKAYTAKMRSSEQSSLILRAWRCLIPKPKTKKPWTPYPARRHAIALTLFLPLVSIAALETLWHFSVTDNSFVTIHSDSSVAAYAIR